MKGEIGIRKEIITEAIKVIIQILVSKEVVIGMMIVIRVVDIRDKIEMVDQIMKDLVEIEMEEVAAIEEIMKNLVDLTEIMTEMQEEVVVEEVEPVLNVEKRVIWLENVHHKILVILDQDLQEEKEGVIFHQDLLNVITVKEKGTWLVIVPKLKKKENQEAIVTEVIEDIIIAMAEVEEIIEIEMEVVVAIAEDVKAVVATKKDNTITAAEVAVAVEAGNKIMMMLPPLAGKTMPQQVTGMINPRKQQYLKKTKIVKMLGAKKRQLRHKYKEIIVN